MSADAVGRDTWFLSGGLARGNSHVSRGLPCQDSVIRAQWDGVSPVLVAAVADGAGSATHAQQGSRAAVGQVLRDSRRMARRAPGPTEDAERAAVGFAEDLFSSARRRAVKTARAQGVPVWKLSTTLAVVLEWCGRFVAAQIGDGITVVRSRTRGLLAVERDRGEYVGTTKFITDGRSLPAVHSLCLPTSDVDAFALTSDGLELLITATPRPGTAGPPAGRLPWRPYEPFF